MNEPDFEPIEPELPPDQEDDPCTACGHARNEHWMAGACMECGCAAFQGPPLASEEPLPALDYREVDVVE